MADPQPGSSPSSGSGQPPAPADADTSHTPDSTPPPNIALRGASLLVSLQLVSRAATFVANQLLLRFLTPSQLGLAAQLEVYYLSVLFFARESLRVAAQRTGAADTITGLAQNLVADNKNKAQSVVNLGYLPPVLGLVLAPVLARTYLLSLSAAPPPPFLLLSLRLYGLASLLELLAEPSFVLLQARLDFGARAAAESSATIVRCALSFLCAVWASTSGRDLGVLPFAVGQLGYGLVLAVVYAWRGAAVAARNRASLLPTPMDGTDFLWGWWYRPTLRLASSMMAQSVFKHVLTQGDTFLVSILSTPHAQGVYALANNYGGLIARMVFQPVEESSRTYFSRLLSDSKPGAKPGAKRHTETPMSSPYKDCLARADSDLHTLLRLYLLVSLPIVTIGPVAAPHLLSIVAGSRWLAEGAGRALSSYCYYVPLLAVNGVAEAFVASVATEREVHGQSLWMGAFSLVFAAAGWLFLGVMQWGAQGLVLANGVNMACRIAWSLTFVTRYFRRRTVHFDIISLLPSATSIVACLSAPQLLARAVAENDGPFVALVKIGLASLPLLTVLTYTERRFLLQCYNSLRGRQAATTPYERVKAD